MIKTVTLGGSEVCVTGLGGQNAVVKNLGSDAVYASANAGVEQGADNVCEIPKGGGEVLLNAHGTVYLLGKGTVQVTGTDYSTVNFKQPSAGSESGAGGECGALALACVRGDDGACENIDFEEV